jgi:two-component system OmpR family response regulator
MIEDDGEIAELLSLYLNQFGFQLENFQDPIDGVEEVKKGSYQLLILDLSLPNLDGIEVLQKIRKFSDIPIIISSARGSVTDKVKGLQLGADDYLPKPYEPIELVARVNAILKRSGKVEKSVFRVDGERLEIYQKGEILNLTRAEFEVLKALLESDGKVLSREDIATSSPSIRWDSVDRTIDVIISRIRHKIGDTPKSPKYIRSIRGEGYQLI